MAVAPPDPAQLEWWLCLGDSEMSGTLPMSGLPANYPPGNNTLWRMGSSRTWRHVAEPVSDETRAAAPFPGIGLPGLFAKYRQARVGGQVGVVVTSRIGFASDIWLPTHPQASTIYQEIVRRVNAAVAFGGTFRGILMLEGGNDAAGNITASRTNWNTTLAALETDTAGATTGKKIWYGQLPVTKPSTITQANWDGERTRQDGWQSASRIMLTPPDGPWQSGGGNQGLHGTGAFFDAYAQIFDTSTAAGL